MEPRKKQLISMKDLFKKYLVLLSIVIATGVIFVILITVVYLRQPYIGLIYTMLVGTSLFSILIIISTIAYYRQIRNVYLDEMFNKTLYNYEALSSQRKRLVKYKSKENVKEFKELNEYIDGMVASYANVTLATKPIDFTKLDIEYVDEDDPHLISAHSFQVNLRNFILSSECFRDAVIVFNIDAKPSDVKDEDYRKVIDNINKFIPVEQKLYAISTKRSAVLVFVPNIDSISYYKEAMESVCKESLFYQYHPTGVKITKVRATMVVYPYSSIENIINDLRYADRQGKDLNIYLPERLDKHNDLITHNTLLLNNMTKVFLEFNRIELKMNDIHDAIKKATNLIKSVRINLGFENAGTIMFEALSGDYYCTYNDVDNEEHRIFSVNSIVGTEFVTMLDELSDGDNSYFFSRRDHASNRIGKYLDAYGITAGHFFIIKNSGQIRGVVFYCNKEKPLYLTSYSRELLFVFSTYLASFSKELHDKQDIETSRERLRDILKISDIDLYSITKTNFKLAFVSDALHDKLGGNLTHGGYCYKELYGLDAPCEGCPLITGRKMESEIGGKHSITSNVLSRRRSAYTSLLITHPKDELYNTNRFHNDLLVFSTYSLVDRLNGLYRASVRGSMVLISIDNAESLVEQYHNEGYFLRVRNYISAIRNALKVKFDIFAYADDTLAIIFNEEGRVDVVNSCEKMYDASRNLLITDGGSYNIDPTILIFDFPLDYPTPVEFQRHVNRYVKTHKDSFGHNQIVIAGQRYSRPASREEFILDALQEAFKKETLHSKIFPIIGEDDKTITGAELLLRLSDEYLKVSIPTYEFIEVARKNNLISKISSYLIDYMGKVYQQYGATTFRTAGVRYFSLNTEISFLQDDNFLNNLSEFMQTYHLPKGFITFEITESDLAENYEFYKSIYRRLLSYNITIAADNYTGRELSLDKLKAIGIEHVKISRSLVRYIDTDVRRFNEVSDEISDAVEQNMKVCLVGIENIQQHKLLSEFNNKFHRQGYFYGEPMEMEEYIELLKKNNISGR